MRYEIYIFLYESITHTHIWLKIENERLLEFNIIRFDHISPTHIDINVMDRDILIEREPHRIRVEYNVFFFFATITM